MIVRDLFERESKSREQNAAAQGVFDFYRDSVGDVGKEPVNDYVDQARDLLQQTQDPAVRKKLIDIFVAGKKNPYIQGGIITTVSALLAGGLFTSLGQMNLSPQQMNVVFQAVLNTVIPTLVSKMHGKSWAETVKYTLASAGIGTAVAAVAEADSDKTDLETKFLQKQLRARYPQAKDLASAMALDYFKSQRQDRQDIARLDQENDSEEAEIARLDQENDQEQSEIDRLKRTINRMS